MIKYSVTNVIKERKDVTSIKCDRCGREWDTTIANIIETQEFYPIRFQGGYGSVFGDGSNVEVDLCQHCLKDLIKDFYRVV